MTKLFNREIIRHILGSFGFVPPPHFGKLGISTNEHFLNEGFDLEFENDSGQMIKSSFGLWSGTIHLGDSKLRVLATDICDNNSNYHEFCLVYQTFDLEDNITGPVHGIKHIFMDNGLALFLVRSEKDSVKQWSNIGVEQKLIACAGFEKLKSFGATFVKEDNRKQLFEDLLSVVEM